MAKITRLDTFDTEFVCFVRLTTEDGAIGWGQTSTYNADITAQVFHRQIAPWAIGHDAEDLDGLIGLIERKEHKYPGSYVARALSGLDTAIWDWRGRRAGKPVVALIGGTPGRLRAYASSMKRDISPEDEAERLKRLCGEQGFTGAKWRIGAEFGNDADHWPGRTEAMIRTVPKALGEGIDLLVDANSGFSVDRAIAVGAMLADHGIGHYEEPVVWWEHDSIRRVREAVTVDVAGGEQECDVEAFRRMIAIGAVDIVQPDILYLGGLTRTLAVARMAADAGLPVTPHSANLSLVTMATMHLMKAIPNAGKYLEFSIEGADYYPWQDGLFLGDPFRITDGAVTVPDAPGWGLEINPAWLEAATHRATDAADIARSGYWSLYHAGAGAAPAQP